MILPAVSMPLGSLNGVPVGSPFVLPNPGILPGLSSTHSGFGSGFGSGSGSGPAPSFVHDTKSKATIAAAKRLNLKNDFIIL
jgi:hypothetical protein